MERRSISDLKRDLIGGSVARASAVHGVVCEKKRIEASLERCSGTNVVLNA